MTPEIEVVGLFIVTLGLAAYAAWLKLRVRGD